MAVSALLHMMAVSRREPPTLAVRLIRLANEHSNLAAEHQARADQLLRLAESIDSLHLEGHQLDAIELLIEGYQLQPLVMEGSSSCESPVVSAAETGPETVVSSGGGIMPDSLPPIVSGLTP